jgi:hypothetical protein
VLDVVDVLTTVFKTAQPDRDIAGHDWLLMTSAGPLSEVSQSGQGGQRMGKVYEEIDAGLRAFIEGQRMFFVATAPVAAAGHINLSPKGLETLRVLGATKIAFLDYVGSGAETIAHLQENGRIVLMLCAMNGPPKIVRLHGRGEVLPPGDAEYDRLRPLFPAEPAGRAIIVVSIYRISDSCGFGVPIYRFEQQRSQLVDWADRKGADALENYQRAKNATSIDGLPAITWLEAPERSNT